MCEQQSQRNLVFLLMSPHPSISYLPVAFPVSMRFRFVLCASQVMDCLSAVSQYNDIQCCGLCCTVRSKDEASLHFLFGSPELLLLGFGVSSVDFQLSSLSLSFQCSEGGAQASLHNIAALVFESRNPPQIIRLFCFLFIKPILGETIQKSL